MKKIWLFVVCSSLLLSSCDTYTGSGAYAGGSIGSILGSAIGGLSGGPRGSDMGTLIGMAGGAVVGGIVGSAADRAESASRSSDYSSGRSYRSQRYDDDQVYVSRGNGNYSTGNYSSSSNHQQVYDYQGNVTNNSEIFDSNNGGDDRLYDFKGTDYTGNYTAQQPTTSIPTATVDQLGANYTYSPTLEIVNARFVDAHEDKVLSRNETCKLIFEIRNNGKQTVYNVVPTVIETTGNKHIFISPSVHIEKIVPGDGVRYTAMVKADNRLRNGYARFCVSVIHEGKAISKVNEFNIQTRK